MFSWLRKLFSPIVLPCCCPAGEIECCPGVTAPSTITATINAPGCCFDGETFVMTNSGSGTNPTYAGSTASACGGNSTLAIDCPSGLIYQVGDCVMYYASFPCSPGTYNLSYLSDPESCCAGGPAVTIDIAWS